MGPVERKLGSLERVHGIVVGAYGEGSDDLHALISKIDGEIRWAPAGKKRAA